jgi:polyhydroxyalkanoate synthesis repressor PhaR
LLLPKVEVASSQGLKIGRICHAANIGGAGGRRQNRRAAPQHRIDASQHFVRQLTFDARKDRPMAADAKDDKAAPVVIKKYANRRLYNTATSTYVTLDHLARMVKEGVEFVVHDAKTGEDITRSVLTQIIVEEEAKGQHLLPIGFLRQLIGFYGDSLQGLVPRYLEMTMQSFTDSQAGMRRYLSETLGGAFSASQFEEMGRKNLAMFEQAMHMFKPAPTPRPAEKPSQTVDPPAPPGSTETPIDQLRSRLEAMQREIDQLAGRKREDTQR